tara:strand:+ start:495 stop:1268 length:774 start_codon:yes stop_codon:yes gene_type:complete
MVLHYKEQTCEEIFSSDKFNNLYDNNSYKNNQLKKFLNNIETNKKYYKMGISRNKKFKRKENTDTLIIKEITSLLNKLTYENKNENIEKINISLKPQFLKYIIENVIDKSLLHHIYIELYVELLNIISKTYDINDILNTMIDKYYNTLVNEENSVDSYENLIKKNNNLDKLCGLGIIVGYLEKTHNLNKDSQYIISDLIKNIDYSDTDNLYKRIICIFNVIKVNPCIRDLFYDELNDIKKNKIPSKVKFKIMDIFDI